MTEQLYLEDAYTQEFRAKVDAVGDDYLVLDRTAFYPAGGGQPSDQGEIRFGRRTYPVERVEEVDGTIRHYVDDPGHLEVGDDVKAEIDWERRHRLMRMHTALHLLSYVVLDEFGAEPAGNQIGEERSRMDFHPISFTEDHIEVIENRCNGLIQDAVPVTVEEMARDTVEAEIEPGRVDLDMIPSNIDPLRVIRIGDMDLCPCGGTHVSNLDEIGELRIADVETKGSQTDRIYISIPS